ncbi:hypothetical protein ACOYR1_12005 [Thalassotalea piscium]
MKSIFSCGLLAIFVLVTPLNSLAQDNERKGVPRNSVPAPNDLPAGNSTNIRDKRPILADKFNIIDGYKEWMIGANNTGLIDGILTRGVNPKTSPQSFYNLKGLRNKRFLHQEHQGKGQGIDIGWTNNASKQTANKNAFWGFFPEQADNDRNEKNNINGVRKRPIVYGEKIAIGWWPANPRSYSEFSVYDGRNVPKFLTYKSRRVGPNLEWSLKGASYEWVILGGEPGEVVRRGEDTLVLFNLKNKKPLLYGDRQFGAYLGFYGYSAFNMTLIVGREEVDLSIWRALMLKPAIDAIR